MSVTLEGNVSSLNDDLNWSGEWQFSKEKKTALKFSYLWISSSVERELFDFVSFANESPLAVGKKSKSNKIANRGRGRPPLTLTNSGDIGNSNSIVSLVENISNVEVIAISDPSVKNSETRLHSEGQVVEMETEETLPVIDKNSVLASVFIERSHRLLGLWKGSFDIRSKDTDSFESVPEVFFFYSIFGSPITSGLEGLPPPPQFPHGLITKSIAMDHSRMDSLCNSSFEESLGGGETCLTSEDISCPTVTEENKETTTLNFLPPQSHSVTLVGFGRNMFGRFSVAAIYDENTGEMTCEKKYIVSKFASKRGRKSFAESAVTNLEVAEGDNGDDSEAGQVHQPILRPKHCSSWDHQIQSSSLVGLDGGDLSLKRKRNSSLGGSAKLAISPASTKLGSYAKESSSSATMSKIHTPKDLLSSSSVVAPFGLVLTGSRDPDSDDPGADYREAFQDCDTGEIYEGGWAYGARYGRGVCLYNDGLLYEGNWLQNKEHGKGQLMTADRKVLYSGDWLDGCFHGHGTYYFSNGDRYTGEWRESCRQGKGDYEFWNGCRYSGDWRDNKRSGRGLFVWPDESFYEGDWEAERRHGRGVLELANGLRYDGGWVNNLMEGKGCCTFPTGQIYQGTYKSGLREGRGSVIFAEGAVYEGRFKEDRLDGQGTLKISESVPGSEVDEMMIPVQIQAELWRIHLKAGFGNDAH